MPQISSMNATLDTASTVLRDRSHEIHRETARLLREERDVAEELARAAALQNDTAPLRTRRREIRDRLEELFAAANYLDELNTIGARA